MSPCAFPVVPCCSSSCVCRYFDLIVGCIIELVILAAFEFIYFFSALAASTTDVKCYQNIETLCSLSEFLFVAVINLFNDVLIWTTRHSSHTPPPSSEKDPGRRRTLTARVLASTIQSPMPVTPNSTATTGAGTGCGSRASQHFDTAALRAVSAGSSSGAVSPPHIIAVAHQKGTIATDSTLTRAAIATLLGPEPSPPLLSSRSSNSSFSVNISTSRSSFERHS